MAVKIVAIFSPAQTKCNWHHVYDMFVNLELTIVGGEVAGSGVWGDFPYDLLR